MRYYFHMIAHDGVIADQDGENHADLELAVLEAKCALCDIASEHLMQRTAMPLRAIKIANKRGEILATIPFEDAAAELLRMRRGNLL